MKYINKYIHNFIFISKSISMVLLMCFLLCGCNVKSVGEININDNANIEEEIVWDKDALIKANTYDELMNVYGSIFIKDERYDKSGAVIDSTDIYEDENKNIAFRMYDAKYNEDKNDVYYDIKLDDVWYVANDNFDIGECYTTSDDNKLILESLTCIEKYNGENVILDEEEHIMEHFIDDEGNGIVKSIIGDFSDKKFAGLDKTYGKDIGIDKLAKIICTYTYDISTLAINDLKTESVDEKGNTYLVAHSEFILGEGILPVMKKIKDNKDNIKSIDEIIEKNTYDNIIKKCNSVRASVELEKEYDRMLTYEVYGDFRGIKSFKSWDNTINTTYSLSYTHIKDARGDWYRTNDGKSIKYDNIITISEKSYYENIDPIQGIFNQKSILWDKDILVSNVINGKKGHIIYETDKLTDIFKSYTKSVISDLDRDISYIKADFMYDIDDYIIDEVKVYVTDKNDKVDERMVKIKLEYDVSAPEYTLALFHDKEFRLNYDALVLANTEEKLLEKFNAITIKDTRYKNTILKDKEIVLYKNADGDFVIKDDNGVLYIKDKSGNIYIKDNNGIKTLIQDVNDLDVYVKDAFNNGDIVSALYNNNIKSIINEKEKIVACYSDYGKGRLITINDDNTIRVEYIYDISDNTIDEVLNYELEDNVMNLKYLTKIDKSGKSIDY